MLNLELNFLPAWLVSAYEASDHDIRITSSYPKLYKSSLITSEDVMNLNLTHQRLELILGSLFTQLTPITERKENAAWINEHSDQLNKHKHAFLASDGWLKYKDKSDTNHNYMLPTISFTTRVVDRTVYIMESEGSFDILDSVERSILAIQSQLGFSAVSSSPLMNFIKYY